jgi:hypothetical protein
MSHFCLQIVSISGHHDDLHHLARPDSWTAPERPGTVWMSLAWRQTNQAQRIGCATLDEETTYAAMVTWTAWSG